MKSIKEIAWNVTEEEYRADPAISYSTLSTFARESQKVIPHLHDKKDAEALRFGSLVDCLMTEPETLEERFFIVDFPSTSDKIETICKKAFDQENPARSLELVKESILLEAMQEVGYYPNWKDETRLRDVISKGKEFYGLLFLAGDKTIMSTEDYKRAQACVEALKTNPFTKKIFFVNPFEPEVEKIYQLKFRTEEIAECAVRCMMDFCIVDHAKKTIRPVDLKTTGKDEEKFEDSFIQWLYMLQGTLYTQTLKALISKDEYFRDFTILPYWFIVINRYNQTPMIWEFEDTFWEGDFLDSKTGEVLKGWRRLLQELLWHIREGKYDYSYETYQVNGIRKITRLRRNECN